MVRDSVLISALGRIIRLGTAIPEQVRVRTEIRIKYRTEKDLHRCETGPECWYDLAMSRENDSKIEHTVNALRLLSQAFPDAAIIVRLAV